MKLRRRASGVFALMTLAVGTSMHTAQVPANPVHAHIGHVMTSWKDTPG